MRKNLNTCNFPNFLPAPQILFVALFSLHYQYLGGFGGAFNGTEEVLYYFRLMEFIVGDTETTFRNRILAKRIKWFFVTKE